MVGWMAVCRKIEGDAQESVPRMRWLFCGVVAKRRITARQQQVFSLPERGCSWVSNQPGRCCGMPGIATPVETCLIPVVYHDLVEDWMALVNDVLQISQRRVFQD